MNSPHNFNTLPSTTNNNLLIIIGDNNGVAHSENRHSLFFLDRKPLSFFFFRAIRNETVLSGLFNGVLHLFKGVVKYTTEKLIGIY